MGENMEKLGTIDIDLVETSPVSFKEKLYRFEYVRPNYWNNDTGDSYFRFVDRDTGAASAPFGKGYHLGSAMVDGDRLVVTAVDIWDGERIDVFVSRDMKTWESWNALHLPGYGLFNTSMCKARDKYVLMFEVGKPAEVAGVPFTARFATSSDLRMWELTPPECTYSKDRYTAPHCLRYLDDYFYNFYLEAVDDGYEQYVVRSRDLVRWVQSPLNPVLKASEEDKRIANERLTPEQRGKIRDARNINNSDIDFCEHNGRLLINYSWGNQQGAEFLAEAEFNGTLAQFLTGWFPQETPSNRYEGKFCAGEGDVEFLRLIDESFAFFNPNPIVPNLTMVYKPEWDTFVEAGGWNGWWIQNSYGFSYAATPFLEEPWFSMLQRSWDLFWDNQGDGKRMGKWAGPDWGGHKLVAPDGCLGDCAAPGKIAYKQGDGGANRHDWFYEATAAGLVMQAEILLVNRDQKALAHYLPKMERACDFIEKTRDPKNNLFLVGPACNLLAPSYGGVRQPDGSFGKGYLAGLSVTYLAALDRMVELYKFAGDKAKLAEYERRQKVTRESLPLLLAPEGYFVKSVEPGGIKHGVLGQEQFGYLEGTVNADAVALRVADDKTSESIYKAIAGFPAIRPFDFLLVNAPGLDDTYWNWGNRTGPGMDGICQFGDWVNGGVWATVEGRAILMYYRLGQFEDIRRSATCAMKWSKDYRMDAPWSQRGENTDNSWYDEGKWLYGNGIKVTVDNYAIPAATIRGLFDYEYRSDRLILRPRVPGSITSYTQKQPVRFGEKKLYISCRNGGPKVKSVTVNGRRVKVSSPDEAVLAYDKLPVDARVEIVTTGGWPTETSTVAYAAVPSLVPEGGTARPRAELPESLREPSAVLAAMAGLLAEEPGADYERAFVAAAAAAIEDCRVRAAMEPGPGYFRPIHPKRRAALTKFYEDTALLMFNGFAGRMASYGEKGDASRKRIAALFAEARLAGEDGTKWQGDRQSVETLTTEYTEHTERGRDE